MSRKENSRLKKFYITYIFATSKAKKQEESYNKNDLNYFAIFYNYFIGVILSETKL